MRFNPLTGQFELPGGGSFNGGVITKAGAADTSSLELSGSPHIGGTGTTTRPGFLQQPTGATASSSWNTSGTFHGINAATGFVGNFVDYKVAGVSKAEITYQGGIKSHYTAGGSATICVSTGFGIGPDHLNSGMVIGSQVGVAFWLRTASLVTMGEPSLFGWASAGGWSGPVSATMGICTGSPEGVMSANVGSVRFRIDGGAGTSLYVKESGTGTTGWVAK